MLRFHLVPQFLGHRKGTQWGQRDVAWNHSKAEARYERESMKVWGAVSKSASEGSIRM